MDARHRLFELFDAHGDELYRLAGLLSGDAERAAAIVRGACTDVHAELRRLGPLDGDAPPVDIARLRRAVCARAAPAGRRESPSRPARDAAGEAARGSAVVEAARSLPARQRDAVVLHCWLGLDEHDLAGALGISPADARTAVQRGIAAVGARLASSGGR